MRADSGRPYPDWVSVEWLASLRAHQRLWPACEDSATPEKCNNVRHSYAKPTRAEIESTRRAVKKLVLAQDGVVECARRSAETPVHFRVPRSKRIYSDDRYEAWADRSFLSVRRLPTPPDRQPA